MMRPPNILYILLTALTTAGALKVTMKAPVLPALRNEDVILPCDIHDINPGNAIAVLWRMKSQNGIVHDVYEYNDGRVTVFRQGCYVEQTEIRRGNADLHIPQIQFSDDGEYVCSVINTPEKAEGRMTLQVSAPPLAEVTPLDASVELGTEKTVTCEVYNFYPKDVSIRWAQYRKGSSDCELLEMWTCVKNLLENSDGTYNVTSLLTLNPKIEDSGNTYTCLISHRSLHTDLSRNLSLTVTEREDNTGAVITAVILTLLFVGILGGFGFLYFTFLKKDPPILSDITGNDELIDMNRTTLTCQIMDFRPNNLEISVCMRRSREEEMRTICTWRSGDHLNPARLSRDDGGGDEVVLHVDEESTLMNGSAGHMDRPLQLKMDACIIKKKLGKFSCQCSLHITPSYDLDNGAELSVHVTHPALTSPASRSRILNVIGVSPKLLSIMSPERIFHDEQLTLTCPINGFKPQALSITWLKRNENQETELVTWNSQNNATQSERYSHSLKPHEHEDKSHSIISALTMKPTVTEDDGVTYICRTFHPATSHRAEKELTMTVTAAPLLDPIVKTQDVVCVGEKVDLSCRIHSFYPPIIQVTWYTEDDVIIPSHTTDPLPECGKLHHVTSASSYTPTMKDLGKKIRCEVQHDSLSKPKHIIWNLEDLASPPTLGDILCVPALPELGKPVKLSCTIDNMYPGDPSIQWYRGLTKFTSEYWETNIKAHKESNIFSGTTELTFTPTSDHHGIPIRLEIVHSGKTFTKDYPLYLKGLLMLSEISTDPKIPEYGRPLTLRCDVTGCNPGDTPRITWSERGQQRESRGSGGVLSCYLTITPTARDYGKVYTCSVVHKGMETPIVRKMHLRLPEKSPTLSDIIVSPKRLTANQKASFQVTISGFSPRDLQIKWYKEFSMFPQAEVTMSELQIGSDSLYTCSSTLTFTPKTNEDGLSIRCEVTHSQSKAVREKRSTLDLGGSSRKEPTNQDGQEKKTFHIREITCVTERPRVGEEVTLVAYIEACQVDAAEFTWNNGMFPVDGEIKNKQDGTDCTSTITFIPEESDTDCTIKLEVFYNYQTVEDSYKLQLV